MAKSAAKLIEDNVFYSNGEHVKVSRCDIKTKSSWRNFSTRVIGTETYKIPFVDFYDECQQGKLTAKLYDKLNKIDLSVSKLNANEIIDELSSIYHSVLKKEWIIEIVLDIS